MKYLTKNEHWNIPEDYDINKILYLLIDKPNYIHNDGSFHWYNNKNENHRDYDLPDYMSNSGYVTWCLNGFDHRDNKPSEIYPHGLKYYWEYGTLIRVIYI